MKYFYLLFCLTFALNANAQITNPAPYCMSGYSSSSSYPQLSKVEVGTWSNISVHTPTPSYTFYNNVTALALNATSTYTLKLTFNNVDAETMIKAWIDYDGDNVFSPAEIIMSVKQGSVSGGMNVAMQSPFTVPGSAPTGTRRMRVSLGWHYANWTSMVFKLDSCHTPVALDGSAGETEDYLVNITGSSSVKENLIVSDILLFPNPATGYLNISGDGIKNIETVRLIDMTGREILKSNELPLNISDFNRGIYFINILFKNSAQKTKKIIFE